MFGKMVEIVCENILEAYYLLKDQPEVEEVQTSNGCIQLALCGDCHQEEELLHSWLKDLGLLVTSIRVVNEG